MNDEFEYPGKVKAMVEELRYAKERIKMLEEKVRNEDRSNKKLHLINAKLEEAFKEVKKNGLESA